MTSECHVGDAFDALQPPFSERCDALVGLIGPMTTLTCEGPAAILSSIHISPSVCVFDLPLTDFIESKEWFVKELISIDIYVEGKVDVRFKHTLSLLR